MAIRISGKVRPVILNTIQYSPDVVKPVEEVEKYGGCRKKYEPPQMVVVDLNSGPDGRPVLGGKLDERVE